MTSAERAGRAVGVALLIQLAGLIIPFVLLSPIATTSFVRDAAPATVQIRVAVLLLFANGALTIAIGAMTFPSLREQSERLGVVLLLVSVAWFVMQGVDNERLMAMLSLSRRAAEGAAGTSELRDAIATAARESRTWAHYTTLLVVEGWFLTFYVALYRAHVLPAALAGFGVVMVGLHAFGVTMPMFVGYRGVFSLAPSLALSHAAVAGWLIRRGFSDVRVKRGVARGVAEVAGT